MEAGPQDETASPKVLYVVGKGRSGSTLLDIILGEIEGFFSTGQLHYIWSSGLIKGYHCGCGVPLPDCEVWSAVLKEAFGGDIDPHAVVALQRAVLSWRNAPRVMRSARGSSSGWAALQEYAAIMSSLYGAIATVTGARVIVDSSKAPAHPGSLGLVPGVEPYLLQLVRDPRAVAYSWKRRKPLKGRGELKEMPRFGPAYSGISWLVRNLAAARTRRLAGSDRSIVMRYEDLAERPVEAISTVTELLGDAGELPFVDDRRVKLSVNHTVSGNPIRTDVGEIELRPDREWRERIPGWDRSLVSLLTLPIRKRYGY